MKLEFEEVLQNRSSEWQLLWAQVKKIYSFLPEPKVIVILDSYFWALNQPLNCKRVRAGTTLCVACGGIWLAVGRGWWTSKRAAKFPNVFKKRKANDSTLISLPPDTAQSPWNKGTDWQGTKFNLFQHNQFTKYKLNLYFSGLDTAASLANWYETYPSSAFIRLRGIF